MKTTQNPISALPKIEYFDGMHDAGPADPRPNGVCPHCGAEGRYTFFFHCDDGGDYGAMSGCIKLFPISEVALAQQAAIKKPASQRNGWDKKILEAVADLKDGTSTYDETLAKIRREQASREAWMRRKFGGRR